MTDATPKSESTRYICIHGHFYQPPRENPWLEAIQMQESARPFHDWNQRVTEECYATNAAARILDEKKLIVEIVNNYSKISFNFGPTLLSWLEEAYPSVYAAILQADRDSQQRFGGHGSAIAQAYNHMIMPLANARDKRTQVLWGIRDFERRFARQPEGMWLPETAVDLPTLEALAEHGIKFTILAPHQARRVRPLAPSSRGDTAASTDSLPPFSAPRPHHDAAGDADSAWIDVSDAGIDPRQAYLQKLPSGRQIAIFFYDGPISRAIAFEHLLNHGDQFADRLIRAFGSQRREAQLVHIATDGETYGHHHRHGEMALAFALRRLERDESLQLTNYGEFLQKFPPRWQVEILERTSWSCAHGIGRWEVDCGCSTGGGAQWNQAWRAPLRDALNWLRDEVFAGFEQKAHELFQDPWAARDNYIDVINDRSAGNIERFLAQHAIGRLGSEETSRALKLLEMMRHAMLMFTSCGWFFSELSGIETIKVIEFAGRVIQLAKEVLQRDIQPAFLNRLALAHSNLREFADGRNIYLTSVPNPPIGLKQVGAHYTIHSLFEKSPQASTRIYAFRVEDQQRRLYETGEIRLIVGHSRITSMVTMESGEFTYGALHLGGHNVTGGIRPFHSRESVAELIAQAETLFQRAEIPALIRLMDRSFAGEAFSLRSLFRDEQHRVMEQILGSAIKDAEGAYEQIYRRRAPLLRFLADLDIAQPHSLQVAAEIVLNRRLAELFQSGEARPEQLRILLDEIKTGHIQIDEDALAFAAAERLLTLAQAFRQNPYSLGTLDKFHRIASMVEVLPFDVNLWEAQNICYNILHSVYPDRAAQAHNQEDPEAREWVQLLESLAKSLRVALP